MVEIRELSVTNFPDFLKLLQIRGEASEDYYRWKYLNQPYDFFPSGFLAYIDNRAVGCVGNINRIYKDEKGYEQKATWFADWFVIDNARGNGIGLALMQKIYELSHYAFGIPGPKSAQNISQKVGYILDPNFLEIQVPVSPMLVGIKRFQGSKTYKIARGLKNVLELAIFYGFRFKNKIPIVFETPPINQWIKNIEIYLKFYNHLATDGNRLLHFLKMPLKSNNDRKWWYTNINTAYIVGFIETDTWGLKRAKLVDFFCRDEDYIELYKDLLHSLKLKGVHIVISLMSIEKQMKFNFGKSWKVAIPFSKSANSNIHLDYISVLDKESSWMHIKMH